ncbi:hypothetical protein MEQU1_000748 [Malassezia equina]|uniref:Ribosomal RNA-processing protein 7 n=1 Tax=Malassezia equina TaxID=1381935 RepID=A0AAF0IXR6_9BASI|nr:hypothetical protein MEQU1_000748 [Malassezia equina]
MAPSEAALAGFQSLPVSYGEDLKGTDILHYMYIRPHASSSGDNVLPAGRTLFVVNVPVDASRGTLRELFRKAGAVESVQVHNVGERSSKGAQDDEEEEEDVPASSADRADASAGQKNAPPKVEPLPQLDPCILLSSCSSAHIVFVDESSLDRAMQLPKRFTAKPYMWPHPEKRQESEKKGRATLDASLVGLPFFLERFRLHHPPHETVKRHVDSAIARYTWIRSNPQWLLNQRMQGDTKSSMGVGIQAASVGPNGELLDEDGFVIVQKGNRYGRSGAEANTFAAITPEFEEEVRQNPDKKKPRELADFYRFQFREKKRQQFANLRAQFEADKKKVAQRKALLRYKPYVHFSNPSY